MARYRQVHGVRYRLYDTLEECADRAAVVFHEQSWTWHPLGSTVRMTDEGIEVSGQGFVPSREQIAEYLRSLHRLGTEGSEYKGKRIPPTDFGEGGRLLYEKGQFGHEVSR